MKCSIFARIYFSYIVSTICYRLFLEIMIFLSPQANKVKYLLFRRLVCFLKNIKFKFFVFVNEMKSEKEIKQGPTPTIDQIISDRITEVAF